MEKVKKAVRDFLVSLKKVWQIKEARIFIIIKISESFALGWFFSTYVLFLLDKGLTLFHANLINVAFMTVSFLFDPSTGRLADQVGQKKVFIWGQLVHAAGMLIYWLGGVFWIFLLAEIIAAVGKALMSEAMESWLRNLTDGETSHKASSLSLAFSSLATVPSAFLGGIVGSAFGLHWPWLFSGLFGILAAVLSSLLLRKMPERKDGEEKEENLPKISEVFKLTWKSPNLRFSVIISLVISFALAPINMFWSPILRESSGLSWWLGTMWIFIASLTALGSILAGMKKIKMFWAIGLIGIPLLIPVFLPSTWVIVICILCHEVGRGAYRPLLFTYSNNHIENRIRSTANSIRSAAGTLGMAIGLFISGLLTFVFSPLTVWGIFALVLIALAVYAKKKE